MRHEGRSDGELVRLARNGAAPAFAVLLHRHGPAVRARVATDDDPTGAVVATFVTAMRELRRRPPDEPVRDWLVELADDEVDEPHPAPPDEPPPLDPAEVDEIWAELDLRWPDGRTPRRPPRWLGWLALIVVLLALAVLVPYLLFAIASSPDDSASTTEGLVAEPFAEDVEREEAEELFEPGDDELLEPPPVEFPDQPDGPDAADPGADDGGEGGDVGDQDGGADTDGEASS